MIVKKKRQIFLDEQHTYRLSTGSALEGELIKYDLATSATSIPKHQNVPSQLPTRILKPDDPVWRIGAQRNIFTASEHAVMMGRLPQTTGCLSMRGDR